MARRSRPGGPVVRKTRHDTYGQARRYVGTVFRLMADVDGYCMIRRKGCMPIILSAQEWYGCIALTDSEARAEEIENSSLRASIGKS